MSKNNKFNEFEDKLDDVVLENETKEVPRVIKLSALPLVNHLSNSFYLCL